MSHLAIITKKKNSLNDISLEIPKGSIVGISGKSGSGKSTLLHLLLGLLQPNSGLVLMDNLDIKKNFDKLNICSLLYPLFFKSTT